MTRKKIILLTITLLIVLTAFNYGPMLYRQRTGNGGTWVEFYHYNTSSDKLLADILAFKQKNKQLWTPGDTSLYADNNDSFYIPFYNDNKYYHVWVNKNSTDNDLLLIFGGVSTTPNYDDAQLINRDMSFFTRQKTIKHFKDIILNNLLFKPADTST